MISPEKIHSLFAERDNFIILGHLEPDGDCLGAQKALGKYLASLNKNVNLVSAGPFMRTEIKDLESEFCPSLPKNLPDDTLFILVDNSFPRRTGLSSKETALIESSDLLIIDHHATVSDAGTWKYTKPEYPAATLLIQEIIEFDRLLTTEEADPVFFGFCTDTGFFRHLTANQAALSFPFLTRLAQAGIHPNELFYQINNGIPFNSLHLSGRILERTESLLEGRFLFSHETDDDRKELNTDERNSDKLFQLLQGTEGCQVAVICRPKEDKIVASLRSDGSTDVAAIAQDYGGGGHKKAAGFAFKDTDLETLKQQLLRKIKAQLDPQ